jgi:hypothetical protein
MNLALKRIALATLIAASEIASAACARASNVPAAPVAQTAPKIGSAAAAVERDKIKTATDLHGTVDRVARGHATRGAKQELDRLAVSVETGAVKDEQSMANDFAKANRALALEHRSKAAEAWTRREYHKAGHELQDAANALESAAAWAGGQAKASVSATVSDTRALGDKLASDATWTRDEVAEGFKSLNSSLDALGNKLRSTTKSQPAVAGA